MSDLKEAYFTNTSHLLELEQAITNSSQLTKHMWAHAKDKEFINDGVFMIEYTSIGILK